MALIRKGASLNTNPTRLAGSQSYLGSIRPNWTETGSMRGLGCGFGAVTAAEDSNNLKAGRPNGYDASTGSWLMPIKGGGLAAYNTVTAQHDMTQARLAMGVNTEAAMTSDSIITANAKLVVQLACTLVANSGITGPLRAAARMSASMAASGNVSGALRGLARVTSTLLSSGNVTPDLRGKSGLSAELSTDSALITTTAPALAAAVWQYLLANGITAETAVLRTTPTTEGRVVADAANTTTSFCTDLTETADNHWKGAMVSFSSGSLFGQVSKVLAYDGTTKRITVVATGPFTAVPAAAASFILINR